MLLCYYQFWSMDVQGCTWCVYLVHIFLGIWLETKTSNLGLFEVAKITRQVLVRNLIDLLDAHGLRNKIIIYVKNEGSNWLECFEIYC